MFLESRCPAGMGNRGVGDHFRCQSWPSLLPAGTIRRSAVPIFNLTKFACRVMTSLTIRMAAVPPLRLYGPAESHSAHRRPLACISHHPTVEAHDTTARTSLRLLAVLDVLFKYACALQEARASS